MFFVTLVALAAQVAGVASDAPQVPVEPMSPALTDATANKARIKTRPSLVHEPDYVRPKSAIEAGEFGEVWISGIVGEDGKLHEPKIKMSSRAASIDAAALADVQSLLFSPGRDAEGKAISVPITMSLEYGHVEFHGPNNLAQYRCDQAVKDYDWWNRTWSADKKDRIYGTVKGMVVMQALNTGNRSGLDFDSEWKAAIEACRAQPTKHMLDLLKPDGEFIRRMTKE
ncbi:MAG: energy transducer TonB [Sphingomonas sp.]|jgi:TonB family protein|uniref:energy transducer TonB n=1 Tax=Sphingomonas sp. TaxID=28214 RepID=UPI00356A42FE